MPGGLAGAGRLQSRLRGVRGQGLRTHGFEVVGRQVSPTPEAARRWIQEIRDGMPGTVWASGCRSWYLGADGLPVLWPFDGKRWYETLREPIQEDFELRVR